MNYEDLPEWVPMVRTPQGGTSVYLFQQKIPIGDKRRIKSRAEFYTMYKALKINNDLLGKRWWSWETLSTIRDKAVKSYNSFEEWGDQMWDEELMPLVVIAEIPCYKVRVSDRHLMNNENIAQSTLATDNPIILYQDAHLVQAQADFKGTLSEFFAEVITQPFPLGHLQLHQNIPNVPWLKDLMDGWDFVPF